MINFSRIQSNTDLTHQELLKHVSIENSNYLEKLNNISWKYKDSFRDALSENN